MCVRRDAVVEVEVLCIMVFQDDDWDYHRSVLFNKSMRLHPATTADPLTTSAQRALIRKIGSVSLPFIFELPPSLPPSVILKPEAYYRGDQVRLN